MSAARRPSPQKKNAPAGAGTPREQVTGNTNDGGNVAANDDAAPPLLAVASGVWELPRRPIEVDIVVNPVTGEKLRFVRISSIFDDLPSSSKNRNSSRSLGRFLNEFKSISVRPRRYSLKGHGSYAHGIASDDIKRMVTALVDQALDGELHPKQRKMLAFFRAIEKALISEALDTLIDRACGVVSSTAADWQRTSERFESELRDAAQKLAAEQATSAYLTTQLEASTSRAGELAKKNEQLEVRVRELEELAKRDGTVGDAWAYENVCLVLQHIASIASAANGKSKGSNRRKVENLVRGDLGFVKRGSRWANFPATPELVSKLKIALDGALAEWREERRKAEQSKRDDAQVSFFGFFVIGGSR